MPLAESLVKHISNSKVSSVLNRDTASYGKNHLFDGCTETCWNSDQGTPQHVLVEFSRPVCIHEIRIQFQGGFAGNDTMLIDCSLRNADVCPLHPADNNSFQTFTLPEDEQSVQRKRIKILFASSTDFYGRIVIYALDFVGRLADADPNPPSTAASSSTDRTPDDSGAAAVPSNTIVII
ncbi:Nuclear receptor 2C2-associated protein [Coemansia sp. RSA 2559]|nr:Nuclear receptor 2C2-associated protein [Coemansia sp. RSA 2559]